MESQSQNGGKKGKRPPPPPPNDDDFMDFDEIEFLAGQSSIPPPPPPLPPPYPKEGLTKLVRSNNLPGCSRPLSWDLNLKAGTVTLLDEGVNPPGFDGANAHTTNDLNQDGKKSKRSSFYPINLPARKKEKEKGGVVKEHSTASSLKPAVVPIISNHNVEPVGPPPPLRPKKLAQTGLRNSYQHHPHPNQLHSTALFKGNGASHGQLVGSPGSSSSVASLFHNLRTISTCYLFVLILIESRERERNVLVKVARSTL